jgi:DNA end-binding protein Ku
MARAVWSGAVSFGLVNVPVKAYTAARDHEVHFHQLEEGTGARIRYKKVSDKTGDEVEPGDIELGYELGKGRYVTVDPDELDALRPRSTRSIDIGDFVALDDIDPIYYDHTYWLGPADEPAAKAYRLLVAAMEERQRVGIGTVVMRRKQYLAAIRPLDGALALSTMRFADEIVDKGQLDEIPAKGTKPTAKELKLATSIIDALASDWEPERYHDTYTEELRGLLDRKAKGETIEVEEAPAKQAEVLDLMAALEASVAATKAARGSRAGSGARKRATRKLEQAAEELAADEGDEGDEPQDKAAAGGTKKRAAKKRATKKPAAKRKAAAGKKAPARKAAARRSA